MIAGTVNISKLGNSNFPRTVKGSWAVEDNLLEAYVVSRKKELIQAKKSKAKFTSQVRNIEADLEQAKATLDNE